MNRTLTIWVLGGALAASLSWNWTLLGDEPAAACAAAGSCASPSAADLGLDAEQERALAALCESSCNASERLERDAERRQGELLAKLSDPALDRAAAHELVREVSELRRKALEACVDGLLEVRGVLTPAQVEALLGRCEASGCR